MENGCKNEILWRKLFEQIIMHGWNDWFFLVCFGFKAHPSIQCICSIFLFLNKTKIDSETMFKYFLLKKWLNGTIFLISGLFSPGNSKIKWFISVDYAIIIVIISIITVSKWVRHSGWMSAL